MPFATATSFLSQMLLSPFPSHYQFEPTMPNPGNMANGDESPDMSTTQPFLPFSSRVCDISDAKCVIQLLCRPTLHGKPVSLTETKLFTKSL